MSQKIVNKWETCKPGSLGSVLFDTFTRWQKKAVAFLADCQCFLGEVKFSIQTQSSAQLPQQVPDKTSSSPETHPTTLEDKTPLLNITATKEKQTTLPPPYAEACVLLDGLQKQMPQTKPTISEVLTSTQNTPLSGKLMVIKNGIMQTASFPGDNDSQTQAEEYLNETAQHSTNPFIISTLEEQPISEDSTDTFESQSLET